MASNTIRINYNGFFAEDDSTLEYVGGKIIELFDKVDSSTKYSDFISLVCNTFGFNDMCKLFYKMPDKDLRTGLVTLYSDESVSEMFYHVENVGTVDVYVEHVTLSAPTEDYNGGDYQLVLQSSETLSVESDFFDSSEHDSFIDTSDENNAKPVIRRKSQFTRFLKGSECPRFAIGMTFMGVTEFRQAVTNYAIADRKDIKLAKNDRTRVRAVCKWPECPWILFASVDTKSNSFMVKTYNSEHKCLPTFKCSKITEEYLASRYEARIKSQPGWKLKEMQATFREELEVKVSRSKCRRAKLIVMKRYLGSFTSQYAQIWNYAAALLTANPGSTIIVKTDRVIEESNPHFKRMFEKIREMIMSRIQKQRSKGAKYSHKICPNILDKLKKNRTETKNCRLEWNGENGYEISHKVKTDSKTNAIKVYRHVVDMKNLKCSCRELNLTGILCSHAIIAIFHQHKEPEDFVSSCYTKDIHQQIYSHVLNPLVGAYDWPKTVYDVPDPPVKRKMPGQPKKHQRREQGVVVPKPAGTKVSRSGTIIRCRLCRKEGHNKTTCPTSAKDLNSGKKRRGGDGQSSLINDQV